jgi:hypothetical protein
MGLKHHPRVVTDGLIFYIDAANPRSYSGSGLTSNGLIGGIGGTLVNGVGYTSSNFGSFIFDGTNDYIVVNSNSDLLSKTEYTKFVFFYPTSLATSNNLISGGVSGENHAFWTYGTNKLNAGHNTIWNQVVGSTALSANVWYCGAVTFSNVSGWKLYLNGVLDGSNANTTTFNNSGELRLGAFANANCFTGQIPLALVYNRALTQQEILQNYNATKMRYGL